MISALAFEDAMGVILTFTVLGIAVSGGEFSIDASLLGLLNQSLLSIAGGAILGYLVALFIAHEK